MKKTIARLVLAAIFLLATGQIFAQKTTITGVMLDTLGEPLINATVVLLNPQDSTMEYFGISNVKGNFSIKGVSSGKYIFQASYLGFESFYKEMEIDGKELAASSAGKLEMGILILKPESMGLDEVTVKADRIPIMIKKDTIEYNAGSFKVQPNDNVEELLKKLPGVEVDKNGTIKAQGKEVQQIMVDGKEFFGQDPKIASQNLPADAVDKVQVYDKKSDMAEFTGIEDGVRDKTINLKLKDGKKKGIFGKISAGYGTDQRYESKANMNRFTKKLQLSFLGRANNINEQGFSFNDYLNFSGGFSNLMSEGGGGGMNLSLGSGSGPIPFDFGQPNYGFTNTASGGLNFNFDFSKKTELRSSYFFSNIKKTESFEAFRQNFLEDNTFPSKQLQDQVNRVTNHRANLRLKHKIDSMQVLNFRANVTLNDGMLERLNQSKIFNIENILENSGWSDQRTNGEDLRFTSSLSYMLRFRKKGRAFTANAGIGKNYNNKNANLESINQFALDDPMLTFSDSLFQEQIQEDDQLDYRVGLTFTEPFAKGQYLQLSYNRRNFANEVLRDVFDIQDQLRQQNGALSNHYLRDYFYDQLGLTYKLNRKKYNLSAGAKLQYSKLVGNILSNELIIQQDFYRVLPSMNFQYDFANSKNFSIDYRTSLREPSVEQLQPILDNRNPLSLYIGNPDLKPEFNHNLRLQLMLFDQFTFTNFFFSIYGTYTEDKITNARTIDNSFVQTTQPINVKNDYRMNSSVSFGTPLKFIKSKINLNLNGGYNRGILFVNSAENITNRWNTTVDFSIENRKKDFVDILLGTSWSRNSTDYSVSQNLNQNFSSMTYYADLGLNLKNDWSFNSMFDYTTYQGEALGAQDPLPMLRASISKYFLKNKRGQLELSAVDILNQGIGIDRRSTFNYIEDIKYNSLGRYFMLTFTYSLSAFGDGQSGGIHIESGRRRH